MKWGDPKKAKEAFNDSFYVSSKENELNKIKVLKSNPTKK